MQWLRSPRLWVAALALVAMVLLPLWVSEYVLGVLTIAYYFGVFAMSWDLLFGYAGEVNFGPTFLIGIGAYVSGMLNIYTSVPMVLCIAAGAVAAVIAGVLLALPALRLRGAYFGLVTLVSVLILQTVIVLFASYTGGEIGFSVPSILSIDSGVNYYYALAFMVVSGMVLLAVARSPMGLILQATGQDPLGAQALGFNVTKHKLAAFCLSALFSGLAGALTIFYLGSVSVNTVVDLAVTVQIIIAAVLGGRRTIVGGALGAIFLIVAAEYLRPIGELSNLVVAAFALIVLLFIPDGFLGLFPRREARS
ncbi:MAG TPA: branched-chain amino acid ABC transporter permease [bacterium]|nr:branched-chain amino acid ABC transporter permease [bacterium]